MPPPIVENWAVVLEKEVRALVATEWSGHDLQHALRVRNLAVQLARSAGADLEVVEAAALLHDIGHTIGRVDHASNGVLLSRELLMRVGFPAEKVPLVLRCIEHHHWKAGNTGDPANPPAEYQVFADADRLDALGAVGIARAFAFGGAHGRPIWDGGEGESREPVYGQSSVHHFYDKLLHLEGGMYTPAARRLAAHRSAILRDFLETFFDEWELRDLDRSESPSHRTNHHTQQTYPSRPQVSRP